VAKLNPAGSNLVYSTYLGGSDQDSGNSIALDSQGNAYVTGLTTSADFPVTTNAFDSALNGGNDIFVAKLSANGSNLSYATFLGGGGDDDAEGIGAGANGAIFVAGFTLSPDFPATAAAFDPALDTSSTCDTAPNTRPCFDGFISKIVPAVSRTTNRVFIPALQVFTPPKCDAYEPNDNIRIDAKPVAAAQPILARICQNDTDNYFFVTAKNTKPTISLDLPAALRGKTLIWVFDSANLDGDAVCANGELPTTPNITLNNCPILPPGKYLVQIYTDVPGSQFDNQNTYRLQVFLS